MAHNEARWARLMASEYMELTTTQRRVYHFHHNIRWLLDLRDWPVFDGHLVWLLEDDRFHCVFSHCRSRFLYFLS